MKVNRVVALLLFAVILGLVCSLTVEVRAQDIYHTKANYPMCKTEWLLDDFLIYMGQRDDAALVKLLVANRCILPDAGTVVYPEGASAKGRVKVRPKGETTRYWIQSEGIETGN
jgi:hypothetical protein